LAVVTAFITHLLHNYCESPLKHWKKITNCKIMNINKTELQIQMDGRFALAADFATALSFAEKYKLQSGVTDWAQASSPPVV